jgi:hypothetical protein
MVEKSDKPLGLLVGRLEEKSELVASRMHSFDY